MNGKKKTGACKQCGNCCRDFIIDVQIADVTDYEFTDYLRWINCHNNVRAGIKSFRDRKVEIKIDNSCRYLTDNGNGTYSCAIQDEKPEICKRYPDEDYTDEISKKCGFQFIEQ